MEQQAVTLGDIVANNAARLPDKAAVVDELTRLSFAKLSERSRRLANGLAARGVQHGDRVAVLAQNCHEYIETFTASEIAGFITTPVNVRLTSAELELVMADCQPAAVIFDHAYKQLVASVQPALGSVKAFICIDGAANWAEDYESILAGSSAGAPRTQAHPDDTAFIIYTRGTAGQPKGVMHGHRGQVFSALSYCMDGAIDENDRVLIANPLADAGGKWIQLAHHLRGCTVFLQRQFDASGMLEIIERERITTTILPATMMRAVLDHPDFAWRDLSSMRTIYYTASPTPVPLLRRALRAFGPILIRFYGGTESGGVGAAMLKHHHVHDDPVILQRRLASAGQPRTLAKVRVVRDDGSDCDIDELGEIIICSDAQMQGYWNSPQATADALKDGWVHTGDLGTRDKDFFLYVIDRTKEVISSGGATIYAREVEDVIQSHPDVLEAAVIGVPDERFGETVHAVVAKRPDATVTAQALIEHCRSQIADYKKPSGVTFVASLPRQENGKIDRLALREPFWGSRERWFN